MSVHAEIAGDFALALVGASGVPTLLLDRGLTIQAASASFCSAFEIRPEFVPERELSELGGGEWDQPQLTSLLRTVASGHARVDSYELDLKPRGREVRHLMLKIARLEVGPGGVCLLLSILDQTELQAAAQLSEELARENALLHQRLQLRIANSLQVIASILLHATQDVRSARLAGQLDDARQRAQSTVALQRLLSVSSSGGVDMHAYLTHLCEGLWSCMIPDGKHIVLEVRVDDATFPSADATSMGLIVTEMAINAIRHAVFNPNFGQIVVTFGVEGDGWRLVVKDNGHAARPGQIRPGLGTGIITALSRQLGAEHTFVSDGTGTTSSVVRPGSAVDSTAIGR